MMKTLREMKNIINEHKQKLKENYGVKEIGFFGSYVRGEQLEQSDLDMRIRKTDWIYQVYAIGKISYRCAWRQG
jgi:predicted nucleotidyltransferase